MKKLSSQIALRAATIAGSLLLVAATGQAQAQQGAYPNHTIKLIVGFAPGGIADTIGRVVGQAISESLKQPVIVENRGGASGAIATKAVINAPADGYTILVNTTAMPINEAAGTGQGVSLGRDLVALSISAITPELLAVSSKSTVTSLAQLVEEARKKNGIAYATAGAGTASHIAAEYLFRSLKLNASHVPHKGGAPALNAVTGGHIELLSISMPAATPHVLSGSLRGLAIGAPQRSPALPDVPTGAELGFKAYNFTSWVGFFAASKTPPEVVTLLNREINKALQNKVILERLQKIGFAANVADVPATAKMLDAEIVKWKEAVAVAGFGKK